MAILISGLLGLFIGTFGFFIYIRMTGQKAIQAAEKEAEKIMNRAKSRVNKIEKDAQTRVKDFESRAKKNAENEIRKEKQKIQNFEKQIKEKEQRIQNEVKRKESQLSSKEKELDDLEQKLQVGETRLQEMESRAREHIAELERKLQATANMSPEQAKKELLDNLSEEMRQSMAIELQKIEDEAQKEAKSKAKHILAVALSRYASEVSTERTTTSIPLLGEEMKGKIIGREGRNIRAMEAACGVDLIIDETPETVIISSFDPVRREVARNALQRLMEDGRVHPARIEEVVERVKKDLFNEMKEDGEKVCFDLGVHDVHPNIIRVLGSLKYRQGDGQNLLAQAQEVADLAGYLAEDMGVNSSVVKRAALFHSIGRALDHTFEGSYAFAGSEFLRKNGESKEVVRAVRTHTGEEEPSSVTGHIVQAAFNLSRSRPGSKRGNLDSFVKRLADLESVANSFDGVSRSYAVQSGKEIRVLVESSKVTDDQTTMLSRDIARKIERELNYTGQIKVSVMRETRIVEHAR
ncbi:MAG: ribonuclease Y [Bdellovibrionaceae bacterium]|nr:ribonuclease Y [Pseudobdellovibrionaceae bacterium]